jgi:hypothetical protein
MPKYGTEPIKLCARGGVGYGAAQHLVRQGAKVSGLEQLYY